MAAIAIVVKRLQCGGESQCTALLIDTDELLVHAQMYSIDREIIIIKEGSGPETGGTAHALSHSLTHTGVMFVHRSKQIFLDRQRTTICSATSA